MKLLGSIFLFFSAVCTLSALDDGWYTYDYTISSKAVENEYQASLSGVIMRQEMITTQHSPVVFITGNTFVDPQQQIELDIAGDGTISSPDNPTVCGTYDQSKESLCWSGTLNTTSAEAVAVQSRLAPVKQEELASSRYDGIYSVHDGTGREILVTVKNGFYTWVYAKPEAGDEKIPTWPTLVQKDGTFFSTLIIDSILDMQGLYTVRFTTTSETTGSIKGKTMQMSRSTLTSGTGAQAQQAAPIVFSGAQVYDAELKNKNPAPDGEAVNEQARTKVRTGRAKKSTAPQWFTKMVQEPGFYTAAGSKTSSDKNLAYALAVATAAADLAAQRNAAVTGSMTYDSYSDAAHNDTEEQSNLFSNDKIAYQVTHSYYDDSTQTEYVTIQASK